MERAGREENPGAGIHGPRIDEVRLHQLYVEELEAAAPRPEERKVTAYQMRALVRAGERLGPGIGPTADVHTWVWSDLHLAHEPSRVVFRRPFATAGAADGAMMRAWKELVADGDDILCLGRRDGRREARQFHHEWWATRPGRKWLVLGNHDVDPMNRNFAADRRELSLFMPGDPPLLLTHLPLRNVPAGAVNVHGHLHLKAPPTPDRHISVCVEQLNYRPARMSDIRRLARRLVDGRPVPGHTTRSRLNVMDRLTRSE